MRVAIHQPNYVPWCGFFAKMAAADLLIFLDDVQMPQGRSYVSRAQILMAGGVRWLTVPTHKDIGTRIQDVGIAEGAWRRKHLGTLQAAYGRCPFFSEVMEWLAPLYAAPEGRLSPLNMRIVRGIARYLGLKSGTAVASEIAAPGSGDDHLLALLGAVGASTYVSGAGGQKYQHPEKFAAAGVALEVRAYRQVEYPQGEGAFVPGLSILDALFRLGRGASSLLRYETQANKPSL